MELETRSEKSHSDWSS